MGRVPLLFWHPVWNRNKAMTYVVFLTMVGYLGSFIHGAVTIKGTWDPTHASCVILGITNNMVNFSTVLAVDFLLLAAMLSGLLRYRDAGMYRLWRMLWSQGIIWVLLAKVAEVPTVVFLSLNLNAPMDLMFFLPEMTVLLVGSTRMYRTLSNFMSTDHIHPSSEIVNSGIGDSHSNTVRGWPCA
ncbi:hypothetical protein OF83DRAFT_685514 [Amylostereum chailletii]|nr:hypothetical protein OF83DRAFT_685514 [Amylostereum chailletii]